MGVFIQYNGQQTGPFPLEEIHAGLASGKYQPTDLVWYEGAVTWMPASQLPQFLPASYNQPPQTSGLAITSLVLGISSFLCGITCIPAIICGHIAHSQIKKSSGRLGGAGLAVAGFIMGYLGILMIVVGIAMMAAITTPAVIAQSKKADETQALAHARLIKLNLSIFKLDYGSFPSADTARNLAEQTGSPEIIGNSSNARFRQLFQAEIIDTELMFYTKSDGTRKPDQNITGNNLLAPGECGFGYIDNVRTNDGISRPLVMSPFVKGVAQFDPEPIDKKVIIIWTDETVTTLPIDPLTSKVLLDGQDILDPTHPIWGGVPPLILLPE